jgi:glycosyltransferase involved in cell wall biosynthesis
MLLEPGESARSRLHALTHFVGGICLVPEVRRSGARHFHAHFAKNPATIALVVSEYLGIPFSMTVHATDLFVTGTLLGLKLRRAKFVASISEYNRKLLEKLAETPADREKVKILHCGIDLERFPPRGSPPPGSARAPLVVAVGRLVEKKGYPYLLEAARILKGRGVEFELRLIGGGPDEAALRRQLAELDVGDRVRLDGAMPQEALLPILSRADVFVLPCVRAADGDQDGIPVSLMEAMAYEIACVSTTVSGVPELITSGTEGLLVPEKDPGALAAALERLLRDRDLRRELGRAGRRKVEREFSLAGLARALDALYRESVSARA